MNALLWLAKFFAKTLVGILVASLVFVFAMRFADGPWGMIPGGAFAQPAVAAPSDWSFTKDLDTVEFQLLEPVGSRTSWVMQHNNRIFIPSGYMNATIGKLWKHWPKDAEQNGAALLRIDGNVYTVTMQRKKDADALRSILAELARKYMSTQPPISAMLDEVASDNLWVFELVPR